MSSQIIEVFKRVRGVDISKVRELVEIHEERQKAMAELSAILGYDVTFSDEEFLQNIADQYSESIIKDMENRMLEAINNG